MNTADYIIKKLEELSITDFFGVPGDYNFNILKSIKDNKFSNWVGCVNELNAGYAADGYARIKGYGAIVTTYGVGELSAVNAIAGCYAENVPVVCIVGVPNSKDIENKKLLHHNVQEVDYYKFYEAYKNITAASAYLTRDNAKLEIDRVLKVLIKEKKPVYIALPSDIATLEISDRYVEYDYSSDKDILNEVCNKIKDKINLSKSPVILGDSLIKRFNAELEYREFIAKSSIPYTNFIMGHNIADADSPNYLGGYYADLRNPIASKYIKESDCVISVGTLYTDLNALGFNLPYKLTEHIAIFGNYTYVNGKRYENVKMSDVLDLTTKLIEQKEIEFDKPNIGYRHKDASADVLTSDYIYPRLQEFFKENDIVFTETGLVPYGIAQAKLPQSVDIEMQLLWASIGWATPACLGACVAKPNSRVILITGEGAHQMTLMEIGTILKMGLKPIIIVLNNKGYTIERALMKDFESDVNDIVSMNYAKFARVFEGDVWATKVETEDDFDKALKVTQIMNKMCYIEVCTAKTDMPNIVKDMLSEKHSECSQEQPIESLPAGIQNFECSNLSFETIVHKSLKEEENMKNE